MRVTRTRAVLVAVLLCARRLHRLAQVRDPRAASTGWPGSRARSRAARCASIARAPSARRSTSRQRRAPSGSTRTGGRPNVTDLKHDICARLDRYGHDRSGPGYACVASGTACPLDTIKTIHALHTLAHEAWHLEGVRSESTTECYAIQTTALVAERLGTPPEEAQASARVALYQIYPQMPSDYQSSDCRDGGPLDLHPSSPVWP